MSLAVRPLVRLAKKYHLTGYKLICVYVGIYTALVVTVSLIYAIYVEISK